MASSVSSGIDSTLNATDDLLDWLLHDDSTLNDQFIVQSLAELRLEHKKTLKIIENLYKGRQKYSSHHNLNEYDMGSVVGSFTSDPYLDHEDQYTISDYLQSARSILLSEHETNEPSVSSVSQIGSKWSPICTVPQPFHMTMRDETTPIKAVYAEKFQQKLLAQKEAEEQKQARPNFLKARPIPASTFLPLFDEMNARSNEKKQFIRDYSEEILEQKLKPFQFRVERRVNGFHASRCKSSDGFHESPPRFKANPVPSEILDGSIDQELADLEQTKKERRKRRARKMFEDAKVPGNLNERETYYAMVDQIRHQTKCFNHYSFAPKIGHSIPDFKSLQQQMERNVEQGKLSRSVTKPVPFKWRSPQQNDSHIQKHKNEVRRHHWKLERSKSWTTLKAPRPQPKSNLAASLRTTTNRHKLGSSSQQPHKHLEDSFEERERKLTEEVNATVQHLRLAELRHQQQRERKLRVSSLTRHVEHKSDMKNMKRRVEERPTLLEQQSKLVKQQSLQTRLRQALTQAGMQSMEYYSKDKINSRGDKAHELEAKEDAEELLKPGSLKSSSRSSKSAKSSSGSNKSPKSNVSKPSGSGSSSSKSSHSVSYSLSFSSDESKTSQDDENTSQQSKNTDPGPEAKEEPSLEESNEVGADVNGNGGNETTSPVTGSAVEKVDSFFM